ncbi:Phage-related minor tail protein [Actinomyces bovis]|uniref:Phage-related minor tail protein n=1 Tax=Actinomyces bovis TaxID=1658 RepID=A0ABY1VRZ3_9ACTO|nr:phage tail tape measure protein [Actinomyces bovis]SPT53803.1 Phage-related minor tail protein [Actinomyces bovis]VEG53166.1 Phage-related minor tail protein [Actinomyces israelii]
MSEASVAKAYLSIIPSLAGSQGAIASQMTQMLTGADTAADKAGASAGQTLGTSLLGKARGVLAPAAVTAAVAGVGAGLYQIGAKFDDLADTIRVGTGASGAALDGMVNVAKRVGSKVPVEFDKVGPVVADLNTRLGLTGDTLETVASQYLEAGRILGQDIDVQKTTAAFSAFGIEGDKVQGAMDGLFRVSQATGVGMNELASSAAASAPAMKTLGFSFEETTSLIGSLDKAGLNSNQTLTAMSKGLVTLAKKGENPQQAFRRVTGEIKDLIAAGDTAKAIDLASGIFGTRAAAQFVGAVESGTLALDNLVGATGATQDTILGVGAQTADFAEKWKLVKNNAALALEPLGSAVFSALGDALGAMVEPMQKVSTWMQENPAATKAIVIALGALAVGLGVAAAAQWVMNSALLASPITWIIVGIAAVIAAIVLLATKWESVTAWVSQKGQQFLAWWTGLWESIASWVSQKWEDIKTWVSTSWQAAIDSVIAIGVSLTQWWTNLWTSIAVWLHNKWNEIINWVTGIPNRIVAALSALGAYLWSLMTQAGQSAYNGLTGAFNSVVSWVTGIPNRILSALGNTGTLLWNAGRNIIQGFLNGLTGAFQKVKGFVSGIGSWIASHKGPEAYDRALLVPAGRWIMGGLEKGLRAQIPSLRQTMNDITSEIQVGATISASSTLSTTHARTAAQAPADPVGTSVTIIQNNPVARRTSSLRDDVATGIRLAAAI